jgi:tetratricopeptide (TPR) repeat protein
MQNKEYRTLLANARTLLDQGLKEDAGALYRMICAADLATASDHYQLAEILYASGDPDGALHSLEHAVIRDPAHAQSWNMAGAIGGETGRHGYAADCFREALALQPQATTSRLNLAHALLQLGQWEGAAEQCTEVLRQTPDSARAWVMLGRSHAERAQHEAACDAFRKALRLNPDLPQALVGLGLSLHQLDQWSESIGHFRHALRLRPNLAQAHFGLGGSLLKLGNLQEALQHQLEAVRLGPEHAEAHLGVGTVLSLMGNQQEAVAHLRTAIRLKPEFLYAYITLAATLMTLGQPDEAACLCEQALALEPGNIDAISLATTIDQHMGKIDRAHARLKPLIEAGTREINVALAYSTICSNLDEPDTGIEFMERFLRQDHGITATGKRNLHFGLGKLYDKQKNFASAFEHYRLGNKLKDVRFNPALQSAETDAIIALHTRALMDTLPHASVHSDRPVFVVGMPRSGTSLVEQILASHPAVFGAGELPDVIQMAGALGGTTASGHGYPHYLPELTQDHVDSTARQYLDHLALLSPDAARVVDKMPGNFMFLGLIELLFPGARIIHCRRDPLDTCLSCYFQDFARSHPYSYDLANLGGFYRNYERLMQHWREVIRLPMLEISYEDMIADQEAGSRRIVEFCGLPWDEGCLQFHETQRYVATASYDQVRRPIYKSSVARWKNYAQFIGPLRAALGQD